MNPAQAQTTLVADLNHKSAGNAFSDSVTTFDADFARFANNGIKHISMRTMWSFAEPSHYDHHSRLSASTMSDHNEGAA
jgi:hypothetical protein